MPDHVLVAREGAVLAEEVVAPGAGQLCLAAKLTIWKYTVSTFCA